MLFNSIEFGFFFISVFGLYWFVAGKNLRLQNLLLLVVSYVFYSFWDWRFLFLLIFSTLLDYYSGLKIESSQKPNARRAWLWISLGINLGFLGVFKYYNFFIESFVAGFERLGITIEPWTLTVILPVGISFYTFHGVSYIIDIYKRRIQAERNFIEYSVFVCYFPLLVAGPIERATHLLPQIKKPRSFDYALAVDGLKQVLWGLVKKVVIADNCAVFANQIFNHAGDYEGSTLFLGALFFSFQIYGDFSGYSDIALGTSKMLGIHLLKNFSFPYFSRSIPEFWRRWHISLSSWFRDYLYIPLGGSMVGRWAKIRNTFITFTVSGFWHGANWTFVFWGFLNAVYMIPSLWMNKPKTSSDKTHGIKAIVQMGMSFFLVVFAWIFFRSPSIGDAFRYISGIFSKGLFSRPSFEGIHDAAIVLLLVAAFFVIEWLGKTEEFAIQKFGSKWPRFLRWSAYCIFIFTILYFSGEQQEFIYFQF